MEAVLLLHQEAEELADVDSPGAARVGGRVRHTETAAFGAREREPTADDRRVKVVVFVERVVFDDPDPEARPGHVGVG